MGVNFKDSTIVDGGCSYGDLNLRFLQSLQRAYPNEKIKGIGIEHVKLRHVVGCQLLSRMMKDASEADYNPLLNYDLQLELRDMMKHNTFFLATFLFLFDKVFDPELCIQILASAINTGTLQYYMSCRQSHPTQYQGVNFDFDEMIKCTKAFKKIGLVEGLRMNGGEGAGTFHVYERNKTVSSKDALKRLFKYCREQFPKLAKDVEEGEFRLENAEENNFLAATNERLGRCDIMFPTLDPSSKQWRENAKRLHEYYAYLGDLEQLTRTDREKGGKKVFQICYETNDSKCHRLDKCSKCLDRFPADKMAKKKCKRKKHELEQLGEGLTATTIINEGDMICQYKGEEVMETMGMYVAKLTRDIYLDAENVECLGRYANHSCAPNAAFARVLVYPHAPEIGEASLKKNQVETMELWIVATQEIKANEWITTSYGKGHQDFFVDRECLCEACSSSNTKKRKEARMLRPPQERRGRVSATNSKNYGRKTRRY